MGGAALIFFKATRQSVLSKSETIIVYAGSMVYSGGFLLTALSVQYYFYLGTVSTFCFTIFGTLSAQNLSRSKFKSK